MQLSLPTGLTKVLAIDELFTAKPRFQNQRRVGGATYGGGQIAHSSRAGRRQQRSTLESLLRDMTTLKTMQGQLGSVEEFSAALKHTGWGIDFRQLKRGPGQVAVNAIGTARTLLLKVGLHNLVHQQALPPSGSITFALVNEPTAPFQFGGSVLESGTLTCFDPSRGLDGVSDKGFSAYALSFDADRVSELAETMRLPDPINSPDMWNIPRHADVNEISRLRSVTEKIFDETHRSDGVANANLFKMIESELALEILNLWAKGSTVPEASYNNRARALRRAMRYIEANSKTLFSVEDLCRESACSISTLERAFRDYFGVSPKQYLTAQRLSGVRASLLSPEGSSKVSDVAIEWGFWHLSKFAADYKGMFGELPSATRMAA